jgi:hypothetical protein
MRGPYAAIKVGSISHRALNMEDYDWEREQRFIELRVSEMYDHPPERKTVGGGADVTVEVRSLYSKDWSERAEDI